MRARTPARLAASGLLSLFMAGLAVAAPFTPGNVVVYRVGVGVIPNQNTNLVATGNPVFLDEYAPDGTLVQTIAMPPSASGAHKALVESGTADVDGLMTRSANGNCLAVPGYGRDLGTGTGNLVTTGTVAGGGAIPRVIGRVDTLGNVDTRTALTDMSVQSNFRGASSSDCNQLFGSGTQAAGGGGVRATTLGSATSTDLTGTAFQNVRGVSVQGGQLYTSASVTNLRTVGTVGSGIPTSGVQTVARLPGLPDNTFTPTPQPYQFFFARLNGASSGNDTLYIADEANGVRKFSLAGTSWVANGGVGGATDLYHGLTGTVSGTTVTLYATRKGGTTASGGGELVTIVDASGYNTTMSGTPVLLATAATNTAFRSVAMAPEVTVTPSAGAHGTIAPATPKVAGGGKTTTFTVTPDAGFSAAVGGTCGGALNANTFTTDPLSVNCTVVASFVQIPTFVATPVAGANGSISPATPRTLLVGGTTSFTITPNPGYAFTAGGTCGGTLVGNVYTIAPISADCTVTADFTLITYTVTPSAGANGTIDPSAPVTVAQGLTTTFNLTPAFGFGAAVGGTCGGTLNGTQLTTNPITADCTVSATFPPLPRYTVTPSVTGPGSISVAIPLTVIQGQPASLTVAPQPGYNAAVRGTCGGHFSGNTWTTDPVTHDCTVAVVFARKLVLFVGNSYTFGRADPVMSYNAANVTDLTYAMWLANPTGSNLDEPHPWGGIPGVFKKMTDQAGLEYDVSISARNAATLRGHYLNSNPAGWDLRGNVATQRYDIVMLQDQSDEPLPAGRGANANLPLFNAHVDKLERWVHQGVAESYTETQLFGGSVASCQATTGASASACETLRTISPANANARVDAQVFLYQTWARPDMIGPNGTDADGQFYTAAEGIEAMTQDLHDAYFNRAVANGHIEDVAPVGDAFLRAVHDGIAMRDPYVPEAGKLNLWYIDFFHPSKYGSYLSAAVHFATLTGINPLTLGPSEQAAADLGIAPADAVKLQRVAQEVVAPDVTPPTTTATLSTPSNANGWNRDDVTVTFSAVDNGPNVSGLDAIHYTLAGAQLGGGTFGSNGSVRISAEGVTTVTYYATDRAGNAEAARTIRVAIDRTPPVIAGMPAEGCSVWPPNKKMVTIATVTATDATSPVTVFTVTGSSSEPPSSSGQADVAITGTGVAAHVVSVRADRAGNGSGRVYTINATATDAAGNTAAATATCTVPHDQAK
jgi:hypothetical protein